MFNLNVQFTELRFTLPVINMALKVVKVFESFTTS